MSATAPLAESFADADFEPISVEALRAQKQVHVDCFLRLGQDRYVKLLNRGDVFSEQDASRITREHHVTDLYYRKAERFAYVSAANVAMAETVEHSAPTAAVMAKQFETVMEKYLTQVVESGINTGVFDEGVKMCGTIYAYLSRQREVSNIASALRERSPGAFELQYLTAMYAAFIAQDVSWTSRRTMDYTLMGSMLHGLGKLKISSEIASKRPQDLSKPEFSVYRLYPLHGYNLLLNNRSVPEPVRQIIYQHRELNDGQGFPNGLLQTRIYPMAKIVGVALAFSEMIMYEGMLPLDALRVFVTDPSVVVRYDADCMKGLIKAFIRKRKEVTP